MSWDQAELNILPTPSSAELVRTLHEKEGIAHLRRLLHLPSPADQPLDHEEEEAERRRTYFRGCALVVGSTIFCLATLYATVLSKVMPPMDHPVLDAIREDYHYCYLVPLTIYPSCAAIYFSWVSLKFFRHN